MAALIAAILVIAFFTVNSEGHKPIVVLNTALPDSAAAKVSTGLENTAHTLPLNRPQKPIGENITSSYNKIQNGRAFVLDAWNRPNEGGRFYASRLVDRCTGIKKFTEFIENPQPNLGNVRPENQVKATAAINRLLSLCGQFTEDELKRYSSSSLFSDEKESDVLVQIYRKAIGDKLLKDEAAKKAFLAAVVNSSDPMLIDELSIGFLRDSKGGGIYLGGKNYKFQDAEEVLAAYYLLPCGLGLNCSTGDPKLDISCASGGNCFENRFDKARAEMVGGNAEKYQRVLALYESMLAAFKNKNTSYFNQP